MNGGQDLGGTQGHGPINPEPNEPVFHAEWEKRGVSRAKIAHPANIWR
jgi:nitrile hydratase